MSTENQELKNHNNSFGFFMGVLAGGLAGAVAMLLLAPQSGRDTRRQIMEKGVELRDRTSEMIEDAMIQVRTSANNITTGVKNYGQELAVEQLDHVSEAAQAGKKALQGSKG